MRVGIRIGAAASALAAVAIGIPVAAVSAHSRRRHHRHDGNMSHVLLISVDGLHQSDLHWYVDRHPDSAPAKLAGRGVQYTRANTPVPSDSFPGMVGQVTGGDPGVTGVYYDAEYNHKLLPAGTPYPHGVDWTGNNDATIQYDSYKVKAILNEIDGYDHSRTTRVGVPAIFGMNFQTVSTAEKLPTLDGQPGSLTGGYLPGTRTPGPLLSRALDYINTELTALAAELRDRGLSRSTAIILSAKHGQSPQDPNALTRIDDGSIVAGINAGWKALHPTAGALVAADPGNTAAGSRDDAFPLWLTDRSGEATRFVKHYLLTTPATGTTYNPSDPSKAGPPRTPQSSGLKRVYVGAAAAEYFGTTVSDPRHPDVWGVVQHGVVYTGGTKKIAEHGGADPEDRNVLLVVYAPGELRGRCRPGGRGYRCGCGWGRQFGYRAVAVAVAVAT